MRTMAVLTLTRYHIALPWRLDEANINLYFVNLRRVCKMSIAKEGTFCCISYRILLNRRYLFFTFTFYRHLETESFTLALYNLLTYVLDVSVIYCS